MSARPRPLLVVALAALLQSACSNAPIGSAPTATTVQERAPAAYILHAGQMRGYREQESLVITPSRLATRGNDPAIAAQLARDGFRSGASTDFVDPGTSVPTMPFAFVTSQALFFSGAPGAQHYFADEIARQRQQPAPPSGATAPLAGLPVDSADQMDGVQASAPATRPGDESKSAYFALVRRGRVLAAVFAYGVDGVATKPAFFALVGVQKALLAQPPD